MVNSNLGLWQPAINKCLWRRSKNWSESHPAIASWDEIWAPRNNIGRTYWRIGWKTSRSFCFIFFKIIIISIISTLTYDVWLTLTTRVAWNGSIRCQWGWWGWGGGGGGGDGGGGRVIMMVRAKDDLASWTNLAGEGWVRQLQFHFASCTTFNCSTWTPLKTW